MSITGLMGVFGMHRQGGAGLLAKGPYNAGVGNAASTTAVQTIALTAYDADGNVVANGVDLANSSFRLTFRNEITGELAGGSSGSTIMTALGGFASINDTPGGDIAVVGNAGGPWTITFQSGGQYGSQPVAIQVYDAKLKATSGNVAKISNTVTTTGGRWWWLPATQVNFQPQQIVQSIPMEVGGDLWARGSYKGGVHGEGQVNLVPRGGLGLAELFYAFSGTNLTSGTSASDFANATITKLVGNGTNGIPVGAFKYKFIPQSGTKAELPWYTLIRNVGGKFVEEFGDARLGNFAFDMAATNLLTIDASFISKACGTIALGTGATSVGAQKAGNGIPFQAVDAKVRLDATTLTNGVYAPSDAAVENVDLLPTRLNIGFANQLSNNEHVVGSNFLQDITNLSRTANVTYSVYLKNPDLYARTYANGADIAQSDAAWSSKIWKGKLDVTFNSNGMIGATATPYSIRVYIPEMDYMATPISLAGNNLVEYQLTTNVVLSQNVDAGVYPFTIEYVTGENIY